MFYDTEPDLINSIFSTESRYITAAAYLKGLHHNDKPTELMPRDAIYLKAARRFYNSLSAEDKMIIDSFSDMNIYESLKTKERNKRFKELTESFICQMETVSYHTITLPSLQAEKGRKNHEHY